MNNQYHVTKATDDPNEAGLPTTQFRATGPVPSVQADMAHPKDDIPFSLKASALEKQFHKRQLPPHHGHETSYVDPVKQNCGVPLPDKDDINRT